MQNRRICTHRIVQNPVYIGKRSCTAVLFSPKHKLKTMPLDIDAFKYCTNNRWRMYKRRARVLFYSSEPLYAETALAYAHKLGQGWLDARAAHTHVNMAKTTAVFSPLTAELLVWADLLITLGPAPYTFDVAIPDRVQVRHWRIAPNEISDHAKTVDEDIRRRVAGVVGGMRLMAKSDR